MGEGPTMRVESYGRLGVRLASWVAPSARGAKGFAVDAVLETRAQKGLCRVPSEFVTTRTLSHLYLVCS